jgi:hypothetical protein
MTIPNFGSLAAYGSGPFVPDKLATVAEPTWEVPENQTWRLVSMSGVIVANANVRKRIPYIGVILNATRGQVFGTYWSPKPMEAGERFIFSVTFDGASPTTVSEWAATVNGSVGELKGAIAFHLPVVVLAHPGLIYEQNYGEPADVIEEATLTYENL